MKPLILSHYTLTNALGRGIDATSLAIKSGKSGLHACDFETLQLDTYIGRVAGIEDEPISGELVNYDCRNNRLAQIALQQDNFLEAAGRAKTKYGPDRIGLFLGTSTSGILETELAYKNYTTKGLGVPDTYHYHETHDNFSLASYIRQVLNITGPSFVVSTACSSSAKVFANASRFIECGFCDAAIIGGVDTLCSTTLHGFSALELMSSDRCRPADINRNGISIGESAGFVLLEKHESKKEGIMLVGYGESSDAYHMATPHPEGLGMADAMSSSLKRAALTANDISYVNLHGTATKTNDATEDKAVVKTLGTNVPCSSTKGWTGHTLGAAGITEAIISVICLKQQLIPKSLNTETIDSSIEANIVLDTHHKPLTYVLSNSFGFGGNNCSLIFGHS